MLRRILALKVLTSLLGPEHYDRLEICLTIAGTLTLFVYGPLGGTLARYFPIYSGREALGEMDRLVG